MPSSQRATRAVALRKRSAATKTSSSAPADDPLAGRLVVRPEEAWSILCCGHSKGWKLVKEGRLTVTRIGGLTLIHVVSIRALLGIPVRADHEAG